MDERTNKKFDIFNVDDFTIRVCGDRAGVFGFNDEKLGKYRKIFL